jgi:hypothetical protein
MEGEPGGIDRDADLGAARFVKPVDQRAFRVGLPKVDLQAVFFALIDAELLEVFERVAAVDFRLANAEQIQVRSVQDQNRSSHLDASPPVPP